MLKWRRILLPLIASLEVTGTQKSNDKFNVCITKVTKVHLCIPNIGVLTELNWLLQCIANSSCSEMPCQDVLQKLEEFRNFNFYF